MVLDKSSERKIHAASSVKVAKWLIFVFVSSLHLNFLAMSVLAAALPKQQLLQDEVEALKEIGRKLGKKDRDFSKDPCGGEGNWTLANAMKGFESFVSCDCSFDHNTTCRVVSMSLKVQNLTGVIPQEFTMLRYLKRLDLSRNCLSGSIPPQWENITLASCKLLMGNKLAGPFPTVITKIPTLVNLSLEGNQFHGSIPSDIGLLVNMQRLVLSSNALTGDLPVELGMLTKLVDLRISDNNFTGKIPNFISHWTQAERLHMMGCSLQGPIPSSISALTNLTDLRITDLKGEESPFPKISNMKSIKILILRNCLIKGKIPEFIGNLGTLKTLDLMCTNSAPTLRPTMSQVVSMLEGQTDVVFEPGFSGDSKLKAMRNHFWESHSVSQSLTISTGGYSAYSVMSTTDGEEMPIVQRGDV